MASISVRANRRWFPTNRQGAARAAAFRRSHEGRTCNRQAACSGVNRTGSPRSRPFAGCAVASGIFWSGRGGAGCWADGVPMSFAEQMQELRARRAP